MPLLENAITEDVFSTHSYNLIKNSDPKVLVDTHNEILTKATTGSVQPMG